MGGTANGLAEARQEGRHLSGLRGDRLGQGGRQPQWRWLRWGQVGAGQTVIGWLARLCQGEGANEERLRLCVLGVSWPLAGGLRINASPLLTAVSSPSLSTTSARCPPPSSPAPSPASPARRRHPSPSSPAAQHTPTMPSSDASRAPSTAPSPRRPRSSRPSLTSPWPTRCAYMRAVCAFRRLPPVPAGLHGHRRCPRPRQRVLSCLRTVGLHTTRHPRPEGRGGPGGGRGVGESIMRSEIRSSSCWTAC